MSVDSKRDAADQLDGLRQRQVHHRVPRLDVDLAVVVDVGEDVLDRVVLVLPVVGPVVGEEVPPRSCRCRRSWRSCPGRRRGRRCPGRADLEVTAVVDHCSKGSSALSEPCLLSSSMVLKIRWRKPRLKLADGLKAEEGPDDGRRRRRRSSPGPVDRRPRGTEEALVRLVEVREARGERPVEDGRQELDGPQRERIGLDLVAPAQLEGPGRPLGVLERVIAEIGRKAPRRPAPRGCRDPQGR